MSRVPCPVSHVPCPVSCACCLRALPGTVPRGSDGSGWAKCSGRGWAAWPPQLGRMGWAEPPHGPGAVWGRRGRDPAAAARELRVGGRTSGSAQLGEPGGEQGRAFRPASRSCPRTGVPVLLHGSRGASEDELGGVDLIPGAPPRSVWPHKGLCQNQDPATLAPSGHAGQGHPAALGAPRCSRG